MNREKLSVALLLCLLGLGLFCFMVVPSSVNAQSNGITRLQSPTEMAASGPWQSYGQNGYDYSLNTAFYTLYAKANSNWGDGLQFTVNVNGTQLSLIYQSQDYSYRDVYGSQDYISSITGVTGQLGTNSISYNNTFPNVTLTYQTYNVELKENYTISALPKTPASYLTAPVTLDFGGYIKYGSLSLFVNGTNVTGQNFVTNSSIDFVYGNKTVFSLPAPSASDAAGNFTVCEYEVKNQGNQIWFYTRTPYSWLENAVFPVTVDPTVKVQGNCRGTLSGSTVSVTMSATPTDGNVEIATISTYYSSAIDVSSITQTGVTWSHVADTYQVNNVYLFVTIEIWKGLVGSGASTSVTVNFGITPSCAVANICEFSGLNGVVDKTATNTGTGLNPSTGTTATTIMANELCVGGTVGFSYTQSSPTNSFTGYDGALVGGCFSQEYLYRIVSSTGAYSSGTTMSGSDAWAGCIATFETQEYHITVNSQHDSPTSSGYVVAGDNYSTSVTSPVSGGTGIRYLCTGYSVDGAANQSGTSYTFTNIQANHTITYYWQTQYYLTVSSSYDSATGQGWYNASATATFSVTTPAAGGTGVQYVLTGWSSSDSGGYSGSASSYSVTMNNPITETASWKQQFYLIVNSAHGTPSGSGWYDADALASFSVNSPVTGTGVQYLFTDWSGTGTNSYSGSANPGSVIMYNSITETADWQTQYEISASAGSGGTINPSGSAWYNAGASQTYSISANTGYSISQVTVDGASQGAISSYTFTGISASHTISAAFAINTYTLTPSVDSHSTISPNTTQTVDWGSSQTFTYSASTGYSVSQVLVDGSPVSITGSYTFSNVQASHTIAVSSTLALAYSEVAVSSTLANNSAVISSYWTDPATSLSGFIVSTDNTGPWTNSTWTAFSATPGWANETLTLNATIGLGIHYKIGANDSVNNWVWTSVQSFTTTGYYISASNDTHCNLSPIGLIAVCAGSGQSFTFSAYGGYSIESVIINGTYSAPTTSPYAFINVQGNESIAVSTSNIIYYVNATCDSGCVIYPSGVLMYAYGTWANFTCTALPGYQLYGLYINGTSAGPLGSVNFMPTGNTTLYLNSVPVTSPVSGSGFGGVVTEPTPAPVVPELPGQTQPLDPTILIAGTAAISVIIGLVMVVSAAKKHPRKPHGGEWSGGEGSRGGEWK